MKKYKVMLNGQNLLIDIGEGLTKYGFYTTQCVSAKSKAEAELMVIDAIKQLDEIKSGMKNEIKDPPLIYAEEIEEVEIIENEEAFKLSWFKELF